MKKIHVSLPALFALAAFFVLDKTSLLPIALLSAAVHECGHLLAMRLRGICMQQMRLTLLGAEITYACAGYRDDLLVASFGPAASFLLAVAAAGAGKASGISALYTLAGVSVVFGVLNLLPALPLDGGRMLYAALAAAAGQKPAVCVLRITGAITAAAIGAAGMYGFVTQGSSASLLTAAVLLIFFVVKGGEMV